MAQNRGNAVTADEMDGMLNNAFQAFDTDNSGYINASELQSLCRQLNTPLDESEVEDALLKLNTDGSYGPDGSGRIELFEFKNWWLGKIVFQTQGTQGNLAKVGKDGKNKRLLAAKLARKQAEADAQLLANRIALLQQEEAKAWKKIQQTKERASQIMQTRERHEAKVQNQHQYSFQASEVTRKAQETRFVQKQREKARRQKAQAEVIKAKQQEVSSIKQCRRANEIEKQRQKQAQQETNNFNVQVVQQHHRKMQMDKERRRQEQSLKNQSDYKRKVDSEESRTKTKEREVQNMEKEEMELIQRLQNAQMLQKEAYEQLESALTQPGERV